MASFFRAFSKTGTSYLYLPPVLSLLGIHCFNLFAKGDYFGLVLDLSVSNTPCLIRDWLSYVSLFCWWLLPNRSEQKYLHGIIGSPVLSESY